MSDHRARYKNTGLDAKELRRRREEDSIQLRKQKRDDVLSKKRSFAPIDDLGHQDEHGALAHMGDDEENVILETIETLSPEMIDGIMQNQDFGRILDSAQRIRRLLSREPQPPFDDVINCGLVSRLVQLLDLDSDPMIQFEVAWILTNICSGTSEQTKAVVESGALPKIIKLIRSPDVRVCEQAVWALGNIVGDGAEPRDLVISHGFVPELLKLIHPQLELGFLRNATWVLVNLCRYKDPPTSITVIKQLLPALLFLVDSQDQTILVDTTWAISYITELGPSYSQLVIDSGLVKKMARLISHGETKIKMAAIRALGCIATGSDDQTQAVIDSGAITQLKNALIRPNDQIAKDALWFISNVLAGSQQHIQAVIDESLTPLIIHFLATGDYPQQKEASWAVYNYCLVGSPEQLEVIIENKVIPALCDLLTLEDNTLVRNILEALKNLLKKCDIDGATSVRDEIEECGGLDKIESLQSSKNTEIYQCSYSIIDEFFTEQDDAT